MVTAPLETQIKLSLVKCLQKTLQVHIIVPLGFGIFNNCMSVIGNVDTERLTWGDVYSIDIKDTGKQDLIVAIAIIVDNILSK